MKNEAGKGDTYRPVDYKKYSQNYDNIFKNGKKSKPKDVPVVKVGSGLVYGDPKG
jgi:hypothetical protein